MPPPREIAQPKWMDIDSEKRGDDDGEEDDDDTKTLVPSFVSVSRGVVAVSTVVVSLFGISVAGWCLVREACVLMFFSLYLFPARFDQCQDDVAPWLLLQVFPV